MPRINATNASRFGKRPKLAFHNSWFLFHNSTCYFILGDIIGMTVRLPRSNFMLSHHLVDEVAVVVYVLAVADGDVHLDIAVQSRERLTSVMGTQPRGEVSKAEA